MKFVKLPHDPSMLLDFFQEGLEALGAVCERSWHDRLQLVAEGRAAKLWAPESGGGLVERELHFLNPAESGAIRQADREVFPGCPLTFHLAEALREEALTLQRLVLQSEPGKPPPLEVAEKLWRSQQAPCAAWRQETLFAPDWHFSLLALIRCEVHAIDQHWSLHRVVLSLPGGQRDEALAAALDFSRPVAPGNPTIPWPASDPGRWQESIRQALTDELATDLGAIRDRQERYLRRELDRIDSYFEDYEQELTARQLRSGKEPMKAKVEQRLAAAKIEHARRRQDQIHRHELRVIPHIDALVLLAEPAWKTNVTVTRRNETELIEALFVPRSRRWIA